MTDTYIASAAMIRMGKHRESSYVGLAAPAARQAIVDSKVDRADIDAIFCGHSFGNMLTGQRIAKNLGLGGIPVVNVENACSGGATAIHEAHKAIQSGEYRTVLVIGVDKLTQFGGGTLPLVPEDWEVRNGVVMPAIYAMRAQRLIYERNATAEDLALVSVKARRQGALNPYAQFRSEVTVEEVLASRPIADPLTLMMCCPTGDGAAAVIMTSDPEIAAVSGKTMKVRASVLHSGIFEAGYRDMLTPQISYDSARDAYAEAGLTPDDIDVIELHDAFAIAELVYYEALGFATPGNAVTLLRDGVTSLGGAHVVNPSGGLLSKGHPIGASGVAQVVEMFLQLGGGAGERQVDGARFAMTHVTGGGISGFDHGSCSVHIFEGA
jgi:acetyl-CoA acetyltransferase